MKHVGNENLFDFIGDLEAAYEKAKREGDKALVESLDILELWEEGAETKWLYRIWKALQGDTMSQRESAWMFDWPHVDGEEPNPKYDKPELAVYWYEMAAQADDPVAQCNLGNLYCGERLPQKLWNGKRAVYWREKSAAHKEPHGMRGLAYCLECGKCCKGGRDARRAAALRKEADELLKSKGENENGQE